MGRRWVLGYGRGVYAQRAQMPRPRWKRPWSRKWIDSRRAYSDRSCSILDVIRTICSARSMLRGFCSVDIMLHSEDVSLYRTYSNMFVLFLVRYTTCSLCALPIDPSSPSLSIQGRSPARSASAAFPELASQPRPKHWRRRTYRQRISIHF